MPNRPDLLAVLIDADNVPPKFAKGLFEEIAKLGEPSVRRCYGDFSADRLKGWADIMGLYGMVPVHQPSYTSKKNSSDIALVIDAMDLMHSGRFDGFVLVSSDSDFIRLASRLREHGLTVYGMGEQKTNEAFRQVCKRFIFLENLLDQNDSHATKSRNKLTEAKKLVARAFDAMEGDEDWMHLDQLGQSLANANPDFDSRSYGFAKLSGLVAASNGFEVGRDANKRMIIRRIG
ncbi:NYN domain-containing protein [Mesobacterium sp. TK19101]|uniref:NYN domain-containing protein n=1 Tax=Mesobacterium hydrothermale TaxID=3111907 RepID=A0ABU6HE64_9RHOB|nr:NYN domain-containing protein [Mesobacterium sp. TK19101]MEC3860759.1 NYN domain-containing protein [Mesobacterium sp. TK19101]